jgi:hypothetical protein
MVNLLKSTSVNSGRARILGSTTLVALVFSTAVAAQSFDDLGFSISPGDDVIAGAPPPPYRQDAMRADRQLRRANVDVQFDSLTRNRRLNVATTDLRSTYPTGAPVTFRTSSNYPVFITRAEIRIQDRSRPGRPTVLTLPVDANGTATWTMPDSGSDTMSYTLRVYNAQGRYDETLPLPLLRTDGTFQAPDVGPFTAAGEGNDRTARRGIPVRGGTITVSGTDATRGGTVSVMGEQVPVDANGRFVVSRIVPAGDQIVTVNANGQTIRRDVAILRSDWFGVGIVDITAGITRGGIDNEDDSYVNGRLAYYVEGHNEAGWQIVSSADTQDGPIADAFSRLNDKDPRRVLDRLRADGTDLYPTYGDDSQIFDNTPTSGNVYLRLENDATRVLWGNFRAGLVGPGLLNNTRELYGLELSYQAPSVTADGDARFSGTVYVAQPETLAQRDVLLGTGGSVYFLSRQDITGGSTSLTVQLVDPDTGFVVDTRVLVEGEDYTVDHLQGVVILSEPLSSGVSDGGLISDAGSDLTVSLLAQYEYTPSDSDISDSSIGGRAEGWVGDNLRVGLTAMREETGAGTQNMLGADLRYNIGAQSFVQMEVARTDGPGFDRTLSTDGGLTITSTAGAVSDEAQAVRFEGVLDFGDLGSTREGTLGFYYETKEAGFATLNEEITEDQELIGLAADIALTERADLAVSADQFTRDGVDDRTEAEVALSYALSDRLETEGGLAFLDQNTVGSAAETGERLDAAVKLTYGISDDATIFGFVQQTVLREGGLDRNNRAGFGGVAQLSDRVGVSGEVSDGDGGLAAQARLSYRPTANSEVYVGYSLDPTRNGADSDLNDDGRVVFGATYRCDDRLSTFSETVLNMPGDETSLTQAYGVTYTPSDIWVLSGGLETGAIRDNVDGDFDRFGLSFGAAYRPSEDLSARMRLEYRTEDGDGAARDRDTYAVSLGYASQVNDNWRLLFNTEAFYSESADGDFRDGEYVRASLGYAYRPIDNERLNLLFRYTYLNDLPGEDQVDANGDDEGPHHRANVLSVAAGYDLSQQLTLTGKLAYRMSEVADRGTNDFESNTATLAALRLDMNVVNQWDMLGEVRMLYTQETGTTETGALVGVYRQLGEHAKIGIGYEWGDVSDDETDISYDSQGLFLNVIGKF